VKVVIHDRTDALSDRLREYTEDRLTRLSRHFDRVLEAEVEFDLERKRSQEPAKVVRISVRSAGRKMPQITAEQRGPDLQTVLDVALDKVDRQVRKLKEKVKERKTKVLAEAPVIRKEAPSPEYLRVRLRPESIQEAAAALESNGQVFHVFLNEDSGDVNVAFRRSDGRLAVIEPVVT
jgi:putative sigma-54 modulation protein